MNQTQNQQSIKSSSAKKAFKVKSKASDGGGASGGGASGGFLMDKSHHTHSNVMKGQTYTMKFNFKEPHKEQGKTIQQLNSQNPELYHQVGTTCNKCNQQFKRLMSKVKHTATTCQRNIDDGGQRLRKINKQTSGVKKSIKKDEIAIKKAYLKMMKGEWIYSDEALKLKLLDFMKTAPVVKAIYNPPVITIKAGFLDLGLDDFVVAKSTGEKTFNDLNESSIRIYNSKPVQHTAPVVKEEVDIIEAIKQLYEKNDNPLNPPEYQEVEEEDFEW